MSERGGSDQCEEAVRLDGEAADSSPGVVRSSELRPGEAFERLRPLAEERKPGLVGDLPTLARAIQALSEISECQLGLAEQGQEPRPGALVTQLLGPREEIGERSVGCFVGIRPDPALGHGEERLIQDPGLRRVLLQRQRSLGCGRSGRAPKQGLDSDADHQHVTEERPIVELGREFERDASVLQSFVEPFEHPDAACRDPFVCESQRQAVAACLGHDLQEELSRLRGRLVQSNPRQDDDRPCPDRPRRQRRDDLAELGFCPARVPGLEVEKRSIDRAAHGIVPTRNGRQLLGAVEEKGGWSRRAALPRVVGSLLDRRGNTVVGGVNGRCELPRASFRIFEQLGETGMDRSATHRVGGLQRTGGEKRVCEPDAIAVRLDDACLERRR